MEPLGIYMTHSSRSSFSLVLRSLATRKLSYLLLFADNCVVCCFSFCVGEGGQGRGFRVSV